MSELVTTLRRSGFVGRTFAGAWPSSLAGAVRCGGERTAHSVRTLRVVGPGSSRSFAQHPL